MPGVFAGACWSPPWARRRVELRQLESSVAVRGLQHRDLCPDAVEPHDAVHPAALYRPLALQLEAEFDEELGCGREVVNHDADVLHPLDRHVLYYNPRSALKFRLRDIPDCFWPVSSHRWNRCVRAHLCGSISSQRR